MKLHPKQNGKRSTGAAIFLGVLLVLAGFLVNKWSIELLISSDGDISSLLFIGAIACFQIGALIAGLRLLWRKPELGFSLSLYSITVFVLLASVLLGGFASAEILGSFTRDSETVKMFHQDARILGMTSEGNEIAWKGYAAVSAAKVALESIVRAIAVEYAPYGIRANIIQAGVTDTPALRLIPGSKHLKAAAKMRNPFNRITTPEDVANFIALMCLEEAGWVNGNIIRVDGGEHISG